MISSTNCPVCENLCSSEALSCPQCGHPFIKRVSTVEETKTFVSKQASSGINVISTISGWLGIILLIVGNWFPSVGWYRFGMPNEGTIFFDRPFIQNFTTLAIFFIVGSVASMFFMAKQRRHILLGIGLFVLVAVIVGFFSNLHYWNTSRSHLLTFFMEDLNNYESIEKGWTGWKVLSSGAFLIFFTGLFNSSFIQKFITPSDAV